MPNIRSAKRHSALPHDPAYLPQMLKVSGIVKRFGTTTAPDGVHLSPRAQGAREEYAAPGRLRLSEDALASMTAKIGVHRCRSGAPSRKEKTRSRRSPPDVCGRVTPRPSAALRHASSASSPHGWQKARRLTVGLAPCNVANISVRAWHPDPSTCGNGATSPERSIGVA